MTLKHQGKACSKLEETTMFTEKQVVSLTGLSRKDLYKLNVSGTVKPKRNPITYSWNQLIFLRVLNLLRDEWSLQTLENLFKSFPDKGVERVIELIDSSIAVILIEEKNGILDFKLISNLTFEDEVYNQSFKRAIENIKSGKKLTSEDAHAIISGVADDCLEEDGIKKFSIKKQTLLIIPEVIRELRKAAILPSNEEDNNLKVG